MVSVRKQPVPYSKRLNKDMGFFWLYVGTDGWDRREKLSEEGKGYCVVLPNNDDPNLYDWSFSNGMVALIDSNERIPEEYRIKLGVNLLVAGCVRCEIEWFYGVYETYER